MNKIWNLPVWFPILQWMLFRHVFPQKIALHLHFVILFIWFVHHRDFFLNYNRGLQRTKISRIHAFFYAIHAFTQISLEIHANPIFRDIGEIFENRGKKRKFTYSRKKNRGDSSIHAIKKWIFTFTQVFSIHAIFFQCSRIHATKKTHSRIHAKHWGISYIFSGWLDFPVIWFSIYIDRLIKELFAFLTRCSLQHLQFFAPHLCISF